MDLKEQITKSALFALATRVASADGTGVDIAGEGSSRLSILLEAVKNAGTNPTLDVKIQDSADNLTFDDVTGLAFTQVTTATSSQELAVAARSLRRYVRAVATIGGTESPSYTFYVKLLRTPAVL